MIRRNLAKPYVIENEIVSAVCRAGGEETRGEKMKEV